MVDDNDTGLEAALLTELSRLLQRIVAGAMDRVGCATGCCVGHTVLVVIIQHYY